jgi:hypothetical protein
MTICGLFVRSNNVQSFHRVLRAGTLRRAGARQPRALAFPSDSQPKSGYLARFVLSTPFGSLSAAISAPRSGKGYNACSNAEPTAPTPTSSTDSNSPAMSKSRSVPRTPERRLVSAARRLDGSRRARGPGPSRSPRTAKSGLSRRTSPDSIEQPGTIGRDFRPWLIFTACQQITIRRFLRADRGPTPQAIPMHRVNAARRAVRPSHSPAEKGNQQNSFCGIAEIGGYSGSLWRCRMACIIRNKRCP